MSSSMHTGWEKTPQGLKKTFTFKDFAESLAFVLEVGSLAEKANHHPDIDIRWNRVHLVLITHDAGNQIKSKDVTLAEEINGLTAEMLTARKKRLHLEGLDPKAR